MPAKLRASCDACHSAKIKCIKTDTGCQRCDNSADELACRYSPALPRIYHKKGTRYHVEDSQTPQSTTSSAEPSLLVHDLHDTQPTLGQEVCPPAAGSLPAFDWQAYSIGVNVEPNPFSWQYLPQSSMEMPRTPDLWPTSIDATSTTTATPALTNAASPATAICTTSSLPFTNQPRASNTPNSRHHVSAERSTPSPERVFARTPCGCFPHLLEAMQRMNAHTTCRSPKLDVVLCTNRTAAKQCLASLQCSHPFGTASHNGVSNCATIACGLLDRILASYQTAWETFCASLDGEGAKGLEEQHLEKMGGEREYHDDDDDDDEWMSARTTTVQMRIGSFTLERDEQVLWTRKIVAREVEKIQMALKGFVSEGQDVQSVLLAHLTERCKSVIFQVSRS